jgi:hypothetical protein
MKGSLGVATRDRNADLLADVPIGEIQWRDLRDVRLIQLQQKGTHAAL